MANIQISSQEVSQYSFQFKMLNQQVTSIFEDIKSKMNQVETVWSSPTSVRLMQQFRQLQPSFGNYVQELERYALFLEQTALTYQENEALLSKGIQV